MDSPTPSYNHSWSDCSIPFPIPADSNTNTYANHQSGSDESGSSWLFGDLVTSQAPPPSWTGLTDRPHVEEYIPPNPPRAMGVTDDQLLVWPGREPHSQFDAGNGPARVKDDGSDIMSLPFFRQQVLKRRRGEVKERKRSRSSEMAAYNEVIARNFEERTGGCAQVNWGSGRVRTPNSSASCSSMYPSCHTTGTEHQVRNHRQRRQQSVHTAQIHVQNKYSNRTITATYHRPLPRSITTSLPKLIQPSHPHHLSQTLQTMTPTIVYTRYSCDLGCRSRSICVHFTFLLGGRSAPDGLICDQCIQTDTEKAIDAERECPRHLGADGRVYLAEDVLATDGQVVRAREVLRRAIGCEWEGVPGKIGGDGDGDVTGGTRSGLLPGQSGQEQEIDHGAWLVEASMEDEISEGEPSTKKLRLDEQDVVSNLNDGAVIDQQSFIQDLPSLDSELLFDDSLYSDFATFASGSDQSWLNSCDSRLQLSSAG